MEPQKSPVQDFAEATGLTVQSPISLRSPEATAVFSAYQPDVAVVVAYGLLLPPAILAAAALGCLNLHPSKLPRWRGAAPIQRTLMAGDSETAVSIMQMEAGLDSGPVCLAEIVPLTVDMTAGQLHDLAASRGADLMVRALGAMERGSLICTPQRAEGVTYAAKIDKAEARIDWRKPAKFVHDHIRGLSPFPGSWFELGTGAQTERIKVLRSELAPGTGDPGRCLDGALTVACQDGAVRLLQLQRPGKKPMAAENVLRGLPVPPGSQLR